MNTIVNYKGKSVANILTPTKKGELKKQVFLGNRCSKVYVINKKSQAVILGFNNDILRHTPAYFLVGCTSAEPTSAFTGDAKIINKK